MTPVQDDLDVLLPFKSSAELPFEMSISRMDHDSHNPGLFFRQLSFFGDSHCKFRGRAHNYLLLLFYPHRKSNDQTFLFSDGVFLVVTLKDKLNFIISYLRERTRRKISRGKNKHPLVNVKIEHLHFALTLARKSLTYDNYFVMYQRHRVVYIRIKPLEDKIAYK